MATIELFSQMHPELVKSIFDQPADGDSTRRSCGCHQRGDRMRDARWWLCDYHEGLSDGLFLGATAEA